FADLGRALAQIKSPVQFLGLCVGLALGALGSPAIALTFFDQHIVVGVLSFAVIVPVGLVAYLTAFKPDVIKELAFGPGHANDKEDIFLDLAKFKDSFSGDWWEIIQSAGEPAISYLTIGSGSGLQVATINGSAYYSTGKY